MMRRKKFVTCAVGVFFLSLSLAGGAPAADAGAFEAKPLASLIEELKEKNPEIKQLQNLVSAAKKMVPQAGSLDDPMVGFDIDNIPVENPSLSRTSMIEMEVMVKQKVPFPGKRHLKKEVARAEHKQQTLEYEEKLNQLLAKFKNAYFDFAAVKEALWIAGKTQKRLKALVVTQEAHFAAGHLPQQNVLKSKVELSHVTDDIIRYRQVLLIHQERLNSLLVRPSGSIFKIIPPPRRLSRLHKSLDELLKTASEKRPWLRREGYKVQESKDKLNLARMGLLPDFDFQATYRFRDDALADSATGEDSFSGGVSINVPLWAFTKQGKEISEHKYRFHASKNEREMMAREVLYEVSRYYHQLVQLREEYSLYAGRIVPESEAALATSKKSYEAGEVDYLNVITNYIDLFQNELMESKLFYEHEKTMADLMVATGGEI